MTSAYCKEQTAYLNGLKTPPQTPSQRKCRGPALSPQNAARGTHPRSDSRVILRFAERVHILSKWYIRPGCTGRVLALHETRRGRAGGASGTGGGLRAPSLTSPVTAQFSIGGPLSLRRGRGRESVFVLAEGWGRTYGLADSGMSIQASRVSSRSRYV